MDLSNGYTVKGEESHVVILDDDFEAPFSGN